MGRVPPPPRSGIARRPEHGVVIGDDEPQSFRRLTGPLAAEPPPLNREQPVREGRLLADRETSIEENRVGRGIFVF